MKRTEWLQAEAEHIARAEALTAGHRARAARAQKHPVEDFLFSYYSYRPSILRRWHPGVGVDLEDASDSERANWRWYLPGTAAGSIRVDVTGYETTHTKTLDNVALILRRTAERTGTFDCFGLHEWAMVYREREPRHPVPLRLGARDTDAVVEAHDLRCTHVDAFRFFTPEAAPRNREQLTRERQPHTEQPGCLHAGMDLYKWAIKLGPLLPGSVLLDAFTLARDICEIDMRASPYDLTEWGYAPIPIERAEGKAEYVRWQRRFAARSSDIRATLLAVLDQRQRPEP